MSISTIPVKFFGDLPDIEHVSSFSLNKDNENNLEIIDLEITHRFPYYHYDPTRFGAFEDTQRKVNEAIFNAQVPTEIHVHVIGDRVGGTVIGVLVKVGAEAFWRVAGHRTGSTTSPTSNTSTAIKFFLPVQLMNDEIGEPERTIAEIELRIPHHFVDEVRNSQSVMIKACDLDSARFEEALNNAIRLTPSPMLISVYAFGVEYEDYGEVTEGLVNTRPTVSKLVKMGVDASWTIAKLIGEVGKRKQLWVEDSKWAVSWEGVQVQKEKTLGGAGIGDGATLRMVDSDFWKK